MANQRMKLTGAAILVFRASTSLQAAPAAYPSVRRAEVSVSFDLHLQRFAAGESAPIDPSPVAAVLARQRYVRPDDFGFYIVEFEDGTSVEFNAGWLDGRGPFNGCAFHIRGTGPELFAFVFELASAGDFIIFNAQGDDTADSPVLILVRPGQEAELPAEVGNRYQTQVVCRSGAMLGHLLFPDYEQWQAYRDQVVGG